MLQGASSETPASTNGGQGSPPFCGGCRIFGNRSFIPSPHVALHSSYSPYSHLHGTRPVRIRILISFQLTMVYLSLSLWLYIIIPGHFWVLQSCASSKVPVHSTLPALTSIMHSLFRALRPPPHVAVHCVHSSHSVNTPMSVFCASY